MSHNRKYGRRSFVAPGAARPVAANRLLWMVGRAINLRDLEEYLALIIEERLPTIEAYVAG